MTARSWSRSVKHRKRQLTVRVANRRRTLERRARSRAKIASNDRGNW